MNERTKVLKREPQSFSRKIRILSLEARSHFAQSFLLDSKEKNKKKPGNRSLTGPSSRKESGRGSCERGLGDSRARFWSPVPVEIARRSGYLRTERISCVARNPRVKGRTVSGGWRSAGERVLDEDLEALARASLLLSALAVGLHYHRDRLAAVLQRRRSRRRHRQLQFVPEITTVAAEQPAVVVADAAGAAAAVLPEQDGRPIQGVGVGGAESGLRAFRERRRGARQLLERDDDRPRRQQRQLLHYRADARVRPDVIQQSRAQHHDHPPGRVGVRADFQAP